MFKSESVIVRNYLLVTTTRKTDAFLVTQLNYISLKKIIMLIMPSKR